MSIYTVILQNVTGPDVVSLSDGSTYASLEVSAGRGPKGDGWTGVSYDVATGRFVFTSNDGLDYTSDNITVDLDAAVASAQSAEAGALAAEANTISLFDQFGDQYLGPKASDPTVDNDGDPLTDGDIYFNTTDSVLKFYTGTAWVAPESIATTAAAAAEASATAAATSETNAASSASAASTSETNADNSATAAAASAASINPDSIDINGGTIDGTVIGGTTPAAGNFTTGSFTGNATFGDNDKAIFGAGSDLQIYHDSFNSYVSEVGTGTLNIQSNGTQINLQKPDGTKMIEAINNGNVVLYTNGVERLRTSGTGVDVTGTVTADGLTTGGNIFFDSTSGALRFRTTEGVEKATARLATNDLKIETSGLARALFAVNGDISFYEDLGVTPKFHWDASAERLGLGTAIPTYKLHVTGINKEGGILVEDGSLFSSAPAVSVVGKRSDVNSSQSFSGKLLLAGNRTDAAVTSTKNLGTVSFGGNHTDGSQANILYSASISGVSEGTFSNSTTMPTALVFHTGTTGRDPDTPNVTAGDERMRIDASGNVGIGVTSTPQNASTSTAGFWFDTSNGYMVAASAGDVALLLNRTVSTGEITQFRYNGSIVGTISVTGSSTAYNTSSDYRLKTDAQPMTGASARVQALNPVNFEWIADGNRVDGFLAHEAQEVVPEAVTGTKDAVDADGNPDYQAIDQSKLVPLLTAALQEALTKIEALEARVTALEA